MNVGATSILGVVAVSIGTTARNRNWFAVASGYCATRSGRDMGDGARGAEAVAVVACVLEGNGALGQPVAPEAQALRFHGFLAGLEAG